MIGVAAGAALRAHGGMEAPPPLHEPGDLLVTLEAARGHLFLAPAAVAGDALERSLQPLVRLGQRARRDLGGDRSAEADEGQREAGISHQSHVAPMATTTATWMSTAIKAAIATGRCSTCQYRNTSCVASSIRTCCASDISRRARRGRLAGGQGRRDQVGVEPAAPRDLFEQLLAPRRDLFNRELDAEPAAWD